MKCDISLQVWNRPEWTRRVLESIDRNTDWESINRFFILDDLSEKETSGILEEYKNPKKVYIREGFGNALNSIKRFIDLAETEVVFNCENDCLVPENWNLILGREIQKDSNIGIINGQAQDLPISRYYSTWEAGFRLAFLKGVRDKLGMSRNRLATRWASDHFLELLGGYRIKRLDYVYFDKLELHKEEAPLIEEYMRRGWERRDYGFDYKKKFYAITESWREKGFIK